MFFFTKQVISMEKKYIDILAGWVKEIFTDMTGITVDEVKSTTDEGLENYTFALVMPYHDKDKNIKGTFLLGFSDNILALSIASAINKNAGLPPVENLEESGFEVLSEFMNIIIGRTITEWDKCGFSVYFNTPTITKEIPIEVSDKHSKHYLISLKTQEMSIRLGVTFKETSPQSLREKRFLVVDDSKLIREMASIALKQEGCKVEHAADGVEAVAKHKEFQPDVTIMDINMPNMGGFDAIKEIRTISPQAKFIMLTSTSRKDEVVLARSLNVGSYIMKPLKVPDFLARIRKVL